MELFFDGASKGNPGLAGAGALLKDGSKTIFKIKKFLGKQTNNFAEYTAILLGLKELKKYQLKAKLSSLAIKVLGDSQLIIKQLSGEYSVKSPNLQPVYRDVIRVIDELKDLGINLRFNHIYRDLNTDADRLANEAIEER